jgi:uncharacterized membrane protein YhaH (DUF805 family)
MGFLLSPLGRVSRRGFWLGYVAVFAALFVGAYFADRWLTRDGPITLPDWLEPFQFALDAIAGPATLAVLVIFPWVTAMMVIKRLHDRGFGGLMLVWKALVLGALAWTAVNIQAFVPGVAGSALAIGAGVLALLMVLRVLVIVPFLAGQDGENRFGPDPLAR